MNSDIFVLYNAGSYGTFIEWCINFFSKKDFPQDLPFLETGSSHGFKGNPLNSIDNLHEEFTKNRLNFETFRIHPKNTENEKIEENIKTIIGYNGKIVFLHPTYNSILWNINNKFDKVNVIEKEYIFTHEHIIMDVITNWGVKKLDDMSRWQLREFLSLYIYKQHLSESGLEDIENFKKQFPEVLFIEIEKIRDNFNDTIIKILQYCNLTFVNKQKINYVYQNWLKYQYHKFKDNIINQIVIAILNNFPYDWSNQEISLIDEAFIQMKLREKNIEIRCFNMNSFPTSVKSLRPFLYST